MKILKQGSNFIIVEYSCTDMIEPVYRRPKIRNPHIWEGDMLNRIEYESLRIAKEKVFDEDETIWIEYRLDVNDRQTPR
jgi:hypothetical protein